MTAAKPLAEWRRTTKINRDAVSTRVEPVYRHIGTVVREMRLRRGWTGESLAKKLGWTRTSIVNIENGRQRVMLHDVPRIARALGIPPRDLLPTEWR